MYDLPESALDLYGFLSSFTSKSLKSHIDQLSQEQCAELFQNVHLTLSSHPHTLSLSPDCSFGTFLNTILLLIKSTLTLSKFSLPQINSLIFFVFSLLPECEGWDPTLVLSIGDLFLTPPFLLTTNRSFPPLSTSWSCLVPMRLRLGLS
ncbi:hypothetical protein GEMRC1_008832 [Eukaryota sp. GEM-RC1]